MAVKWTKIRGVIGAIVAIVVLVIFASGLTVVAGVKIPGLTNIAEMLGIDKLKEE